MSTPRRIRLSRAKGWRLPEGAVNCARPGPLGNPFVVGKDGDRTHCVELHRALLAGLICLSAGPSIEEQQAHVEAVRKAMPNLRGRDLACWCALDGKPCHVDTILELANREGDA